MHIFCLFSQSTSVMSFNLNLHICLLIWFHAIGFWIIIGVSVSVIFMLLLRCWVSQRSMEWLFWAIIWIVWTWWTIDGSCGGGTHDSTRGLDHMDVSENWCKGLLFSSHCSTLYVLKTCRVFLTYVLKWILEFYCRTLYAPFGHIVIFKLLLFHSNQFCQSLFQRSNCLN